MYKKKYLVALSGGADSVCLLLKMLDEGREVEAVHCNFHLRGEESDCDEAFVAALCARLGVVLHRVHFDTREYAALHKVSIEMAARELRYRYFEQLRRDIGAEGVMVAHHRDDNVETVLMNMVRGTGLRGVAGIRPVNGHILRPLLDMSRQDIEDYLAARGETYVTDSTNLEDEATRNKFRLNVIPLLKTINPKACENIHATSRHIAEAETIVDWAVAVAKAEVVTAVGSGDSAEGGDDSAAADVFVDIARLQAFVAPEYLLHEITSEYGFTPSQSADMLRSAAERHVGATFSSDSHIAAVANSGGRLCLHIAPLAAAPREFRLPEEGKYNLADGVRITVERRPVGAGFEISKAPNCATININKVKFPLVCRPAREGDRFTPFGMRGSKLVSDYLTDIKCSVIDRRRQMVVADATGMILWLVGRRTSDLCRIDGSTTEALVISIG